MIEERKKPTLPTPALHTNNPGTLIPANGRTPFCLARVTAVEYGAKKAQILVAIPGVGEFECDLVHATGKEPFLAPRSVQENFSRGWVKTFRLERQLVADILQAVLERLGGGLETAEPSPSQPFSQGRSVERVSVRATQDDGAYDDREVAFDEAVARFDGAP